MCAFVFSFVVAFSSDEPFGAHLVKSKYGMPWFLRERENILVIIRDAGKGQIFLRDLILQQG